MAYSKIGKNGKEGWYYTDYGGDPRGPYNTKESAERAEKRNASAERAAHKALYHFDGSDDDWDDRPCDQDDY